LITRGYEHLYLLYSYEHKELSQNTIQGCYEALDEHGISRDVLELFSCRTHDPEPYYKTTMEKIEYQGKRIGIFAWDDQTAIGVYRAVSDKGLNIPEQVGIVGFDDIKLARFFPKSLTTIHCPKIEMGQRAAERLIQQITSDAKLESQKLMLPLKLIVRETT
jgi:LacI family transcriptional regulator